MRPTTPAPFAAALDANEPGTLRRSALVHLAARAGVAVAVVGLAAMFVSASASGDALCLLRSHGSAADATPHQFTNPCLAGSLLTFGLLLAGAAVLAFAALRRPARAGPSRLEG